MYKVLFRCIMHPDPWTDNLGPASFYEPQGLSHPAAPAALQADGLQLRAARGPQPLARSHGAAANGLVRPQNGVWNSTAIGSLDFNFLVEIKGFSMKPTKS